MFELARLALPATEYSQFTFPTYRALLADPNHAIAVGAKMSGYPVGLALASVQPGCNLADVCSLAVADRFRRQGLGASLLQALSDELARRCVRAEAVCTEASPHFPIVQQLLERQGWGPLRRRTMICHSDLGSILSAPWMHKSLLPAAFTVFPWKELRDYERTAIERFECFPYPPILSPFRDSDPFEPISSLGLRYRNQLVGWLVTHLASYDTLRFTSLVVREDLEKRARGISLLIEAMARYKTQPIAQIVRKGIFNIHVDNHSMMAFAERRLAPFMTKIYYSYSASKNYAPD